MWLRSRMAFSPVEIVAGIEDRLRLHATSTADRLKRYGHARETVWTEWQGRKVVAVGNELVFSPEDRQWTFHDFLLDDAQFSARSGRMTS